MIWSKLKDHFQSNPLTRLTWGIEPRNKKRRLRAICHLLTPILIYLVINFIWQLLVMQLSSQSFVDSFTRYFFVVFGGNVAILILPCWWVFAGPNSHALKTNMADYLLSGMRYFQIVLGLASPHLFGILLVSVLHLLVIAVSIPIWAGSLKEQLESLGSIIFLNFFLAYPTFVLLPAILFDLARISDSSSRFTRILAIYGLGMISSPLIMGTCILPIIFSSPFPFFMILGAELISWLPKGYVVWRAWRRLMR